MENHFKAIDDTPTNNNATIFEWHMWLVTSSLIIIN